jgi:ATP-dependent RNA helicase RhlE
VQSASLTTFPSLGLPDFLLQATRELGYETPTAVQARAVVRVAAGWDLAVEAPTGSGKTAAFALPLLQRLFDDGAAPRKDSAPTARSPRILTIAPTRELALQVARSFEDLGQFAPVPPRVLAIIGGTSIDDQVAALSAGVDVVVATPGRLLDLVFRQAIALDQVQALVLDEADRLLDAGFSEELDTLLAALPEDRQTLLFSATLPERVLSLSAKLMRDPETVRIDPTPTPAEGIAQRVFLVDAAQRRPLLQDLIETEKWGETLVFVSTRRASENLAAKLRVAGFRAAALHGDLDQSERERVLDRFKRRRTAILVATDLAARGIDIPGLRAVVNFDLPRSPDDYLHRIGRTGRAGETGIAVSFIDHDTARHFQLIEKRSDIHVPRAHQPGFEMRGTAPARVKGQAPVKGKRKSKKDKLREAAAAQASREATPGATLEDEPQQTAQEE